MTAFAELFETASAYAQRRGITVRLQSMEAEKPAVFASEYGVSLLGELTVAAAIPGYTGFFRANADAMTIFHREGKAPAWPDFFPSWKARARRGEIEVRPYTPRPIPDFAVPRIENQEVVQERD